MRGFGVRVPAHPPRFKMKTKIDTELDDISVCPDCGDTEYEIGSESLHCFDKEFSCGCVITGIQGTNTGILSKECAFKEPSDSDFITMMKRDIKRSLFYSAERLPRFTSWISSDGRLSVLEIHSTTQEEEIKILKDLINSRMMGMRRTFNNKRPYTKSSRQRTRMAIYRTLNANKWEVDGEDY